MKLHNPNGLITIRVKNLSKNENPIIEKLSFDGIIFGTKFLNKWYANTGVCYHFLGLRFAKHIIYEGQFLLTAKDKKLINRFKQPGRSKDYTILLIAFILLVAVISSL